MSNLFRRLFEALVYSSEDDLRRQIQYLKAENEILRAKISGPVRLEPEERARLVKLGRPLGKTIKALISVAKPETFLRWVREADKVAPRKRATRKPGRPRTPEDIRRLILRIARETGWGYTRILGELKKLGIRSVSRSTVMNILKEANLPTGPQRDEATWDEFIKSHAKTLWACDFLSQRIITPKGCVDAFILLFVNVATRRVFASTSTRHPDAAWVAEQVEEFAQATGGHSTECRVMTRDRDSKFGKAFDAALRTEDITPVQLPFRSPNLNAHVERFIQSLQNECLRKFLILGTRHLDHLVMEYVQHYNLERPHSRIGHRTPAGRATPLRIAKRDDLDARGILCSTRLGGVLRHYRRSAA